MILTIGHVSFVALRPRPRVLGGAAYSEQTVRVLDANVYHLSFYGFPEWEEFAKAKPWRRLDINSRPNRIPLHKSCSSVRQVKARWVVMLNNQRLGNLLNIDSKLVHSITVPPGKRKPVSTLSIVAPKTTDDIEVGPVPNRPAGGEKYFPRLSMSTLPTNKLAATPSRITIMDAYGALAALRPAPEQRLAHRPGVVYTGGDLVRKNCCPANTRSTLPADLSIAWPKPRSPFAPASPQGRLALIREVPTPGLVATDTHPHATRSGHGDSTEHERMYTIAGEGIEFAITPTIITTPTIGLYRNHRHLHPFTAVTGNEVTTKTGHFNAFPINTTSPVPDAKLTDWTQLMKSIRATPGVRVVVLNHPRNTHSGFSPVAPEHFNRITGRNLYGAPYSFDAMEVVTSAAMQSDFMAPYRDWFAMLNWGHPITGVGSSDTHDVSRFILGQARTYVECPDTHPDKINITKACESFRNMRAYISMGLLVHMQVDGRYRSGDVATGLNKEMKSHTRGLGPSWVRADRLELFTNGHRILTRDLPPTSKIEKANLTFTLPRPLHDAHLIAIATGPGITEPFWESPRPYVPTTPNHTPAFKVLPTPFSLMAMGTGNKRPRAQARQLLAKHARDLRPLFNLWPNTISPFPPKPALLYQADHDLTPQPRRHWTRTPSTKAGFTAYLGTLQKNRPNPGIMKSE